MKRESPKIGYYPAAPSKHPGNSERSGRPSRTAMLRFYGAIAVCACVFVVCAVLLIRYYANIAASRHASEQLGEIYQSSLAATDAPAETLPSSSGPTAAPRVTPLPTQAQTPAPAAQASAAPAGADELWPTVYPDNPKLKVSAVFDELQAQNRDIVAWLKLEGELEEPVVQRDNVYYLTHNALCQKSITGALFLDETCDLIHVPTQMVVHGHNMKEGAMFGCLKKYKVKGAAYYKEHAYIDFNTLYENGRYVIFAVAEVDIRSGHPYYLPFWQYSRFTDEKQFTDYVASVRACSMYRCKVDVQPGDRLLTLSTCTGTDDNMRLVVMARKIRPDENLLDLNMAVMSTVDK